MKVLVAEDDPVCLVELVDALTEWGYEVVTATDGKEALNLLSREDALPLAILDWQMPGMDGVEVVRQLRALNRPPYAYVLVLTARSRPHDVVAAIDAGADDFITKPCDERELEVRLRAGRRILDLQEQLRYQASHDALTGVWNRGVIFELLRRDLARGERGKTPTAVLMVDLDHFKAINDRHGHPAGDTVLQETARRMAAVLRAQDAIGRYGGEEFLIVLPESDPSGAMEVAERVRACVAVEPVMLAEHSLTVTASLGVAVADRPGRVTAAALVRAADEALYRAKDAGRNRACLGVLKEESTRLWK